MTVFTAFALTSAAGATVVALGVAVRATTSVSRWSFAAGMAVLAGEAFLSALGAEAADLGHLRTLQQWRLGVTSFAPFTWLLFSLTYARGNARVGRGAAPGLLVSAAALPLLAFFWRQEALIGPAWSGPLAGAAVIFHLGWTGLLLHALCLLGAIGVVMNLERTFRASVGTIRWRIKFMLIGVGVVFVTRIYTGSQTLVFRALDPALDSLDVGALLAALPLIFRSFLRRGPFEVDVYPSHSVLRHSLTLLLTGAYLIIIGVLAKAVVYLGGDATFELKAFLVLVALVMLTLALQSDRVQQRLAQFVSRHFQRPVYDYRAVWKKVTEATASRMNQADLSQTLAALVTEFFQALSVNVWLPNERKDTLILAASTASPVAKDGRAKNLSLDFEAVRTFFLAHPAPVDFEDSSSPWAAALRAAQHVQFPHGGRRYSVPLLGQGEILGVITLGDRVNGVPLSAQDLELLKCVADHGAACLMNLQLAQRLLEARELAAFQTMAAFFVHDLKNAASTLNLMLQNLPAHFDNPAFRADALRSVGKSVTHINRLIGRLGQLRHEMKVVLASADLNVLVAQALSGFEQSSVILLRDLRPVPLLALDVEQFSKVVVNLVLNATEAVSTGGQVSISSGPDESGVVLTVSDDGCGMSPEFVALSLFRPFQTTKKSGLGVGMFQSKMIIEAHGGRITVTSRPGGGSTFRVFLPLPTPMLPSARNKNPAQKQGAFIPTSHQPAHS